MRFLMSPTILALSLMGCAELPQEGRAAAILTQAQPLAVEHAGALTGEDVDEMRRTGLRLITVVRCGLPDGCPQ